MKKFIEVSIIPLGTKDTGLRKYVKEFIKVLREKNERVYVNAMSTVIETENLRSSLNSILEAHEKMFQLGLRRVLLEIRIDDRRDKVQNYNDRIKDL